MRIPAFGNVGDDHASDGTISRPRPRPMAATPDLPTQVVSGRKQRLLLRICLDGPVPGDGSGPSGYVR